MRVISAITVLVPSYEEGLNFFVGTLGFTVIEDTVLSPTKRWVLVAPSRSAETRLLLARADGPEQVEAIGNQSGGRVFLFLRTDDIDRDYKRFRAAGVSFAEEPRVEAYGTVAVFTDPFGNRWDLIEPRDGNAVS